MSISVQSRNFTSPYAHLNGTATLSATHVDLIHAIVRVGYASRDAAVRTVGLWRALQLESLAIGYITGDLKVTQFYRNLEQTEKAFASFLLAEALTLIYAEQSLQVRHLLHLTSIPGFQWQRPLSSVVMKQGATPAGEKARPDFIGWDGIDYHIFETKGRVRRPAKETLAKALWQVSRVSTINGRAPATRCVASFIFHKDRISGTINDPEGETEGCSARFDELNMLKIIYKIFTDLLQDTSRAFSDKFLTVDISDETSISIDRRIYKAITDEPKTTSERQARVREVVSLMDDAYESNQGRRSDSLSVSRVGTVAIDRGVRHRPLNLF